MRTMRRTVAAVAVAVAVADDDAVRSTRWTRSSHDQLSVSLMRRNRVSNGNFLPHWSMTWMRRMRKALSLSDNQLNEDEQCRV